MARTTMEAGATPEAHMIPNVIAEFYIWAEEASSWQVAMYEWAEKLKEALETRDIPVADPPPVPPKRWP